MTMAQIFSVLLARWRFALLVMVLVVSAVAAVTFLRKPLYTATASVVLDVKSPDPIAGVVLPGMTVAGYMATQLGVMQSERVALRALKALRMDDDPVLKAQWREVTEGRGNYLAWLAEVVMRRLEVVPARDSNVISVAYTSTDPAQAAAVANAFVKAYIDTTLDLRVEPAKQYNSFFDGSAKTQREALERAQAKLSAYQQEKGIVASDERLDVENLRLAELSTQLVALQAVANESGNRQSQSGSNADRMQEVLNSPLLVGLTTELARNEGRLNELTARLGDNNPQVVELRSNIAQMRDRIASETRRVVGSLAVNNNVNQGRLDQLRAAVNEQRNKLLQLKGQRDEATVLLRDVENAQRAYDAVLTRASQSSVESQATQTNVSVLKNASEPPLPSSPRVVLNLLVGVFVGGMLALVGSLMRESFDRRLRSESDVLLGLRQPLLGVLPSGSRARRDGRARLRLGTQAMRGLPAPLGR